MSDHRTPNVLLAGGPRNRSVASDQAIHVPDLTVAKIKVCRGDRYHHYEPSGRTVVHGDRTLQVFVWTGCTYVAE